MDDRSELANANNELLRLWFTDWCGLYAMSATVSKEPDELVELRGISTYGNKLF